jgi:hypothetical protein
MSEGSLYLLIQDIDKHIEEIINNKLDINLIKQFLTFRNEVILKYKPLSNKDWTIQNKKISEAIIKMNWNQIYIWSILITTGITILI